MAIRPATLLVRSAHQGGFSIYMPMRYDKPAVGIEAQIALLKGRGLRITDEAKAAHFSNISYYRLRAYTYPFQDNSDPTHPFVQNIEFSDVISLYVFDRKLRILVFDALEKIEVALRTKVIYHMALGCGSHWHMDSSLFHDEAHYQRDFNTLLKELKRSKESFILHYNAKYSEPSSPPAWMSLEVASMNLLAKFYENLKKCREKRTVALAFGLMHESILESWMHSFAQLRNICAHHGRLWNRRLVNTPTIPKRTTCPFLLNRDFHINKPYPQLCCVAYVLNIISPKHGFADRLKSLIIDFPIVGIKEMGFPPHWEKEPVWQTTEPQDLG